MAPGPNLWPTLPPLELTPEERSQREEQLLRDSHEHESDLDGCPSPDFRSHRYFHPSYEQRRRRKQAVEALVEDAPQAWRILTTGNKVIQGGLTEGESQSIVARSSQNGLCHKKRKIYETTYPEIHWSRQDTLRRFRIAKRTAPRRMRTRSLQGPEPIVLSDRKGFVRLWWKQLCEYVEITYESFETYFVSSAQTDQSDD